MEEYTLLKVQKNQVFKILQSEGLETFDFNWSKEEFEKLLVDCLNYQDGDFYFIFGLDDYNHHYCSFTPSEGIAHKFEVGFTWDGLIRHFEEWVVALKKEIEAPDLWGELEKYQSALMLGPSEELVNEPIPAFEADEMHDRLSLLADKIEQKFQLQEEESKFVRQKLNYLSDAARRQPRRDWETMVIGVMISIAIRLALPPEQAQSFFALVKECLGKLIHLIGS